MNSPIGPVWTRVLLIVEECILARTEAISAALYHRKSAPSHMAGLLTAMERRGLIERSLPVGDVWLIGSEGRVVLNELRRPQCRRYRTDKVSRIKAKHRRDGLMALGLCLNGALHGKATRGCRCDACYVTHRRSA